MEKKIKKDAIKKDAKELVGKKKKLTLKEDCFINNVMRKKGERIELTQDQEEKLKKADCL